MASHSAVPFEYGEGDDDLPSFMEMNQMRRIIDISMTTLRLSAFQQVTTKVPPSYDGRK